MDAPVVLVACSRRGRRRLKSRLWACGHQARLRGLRPGDGSDCGSADLVGRGSLRRRSFVADRPHMRASTAGSWPAGPIYGRAASTSRAAVATAALVRPYLSSNSCGLPDSAKPVTPTTRIGVGRCWASDERDLAGQPAVMQVLLGDDDRAGLVGGGQHRHLVERLDGVHVEHARLRRPRPASASAASSATPTIRPLAMIVRSLAVAHGVRLAECQAAGAVVDERHVRPAGAQVGRAVAGRRCRAPRRASRLVGRDDDGEARQRAARARCPRSPSATGRPRRC